MDTLKNIWKAIKDSFYWVWDTISDSNTLVRWLLILGGAFIMMRFAGFEIEEFRVTWLLFWYALSSTVIASFMCYVYGKVNYHRAKNDPAFIQAQAIIFASTYIFSGLVILGTYIAQYN